VALRTIGLRAYTPGRYETIHILLLLLPGQPGAATPSGQERHKRKTSPNLGISVRESATGQSLGHSLKHSRTPSCSGRATPPPPTVSIVAGTLQEAGLISCRRGFVHIRDRAGLEAAACECYGAMRALNGHFLDGPRE
jgi:hypothetical protein